MEMTLPEAAARLGVTIRQAQRLAQAGRLQIVRRVGRNVIVDDSGIAAIERAQRTPGRRWAAQTCWAAIELLTTGDTDRVSSASSKARLRAKLRGVSTTEFVRLAADRARVVRMTQTLGLEADLMAAMVLTGRTALAETRLAEQLELSSGRGGVIEGYVTEDEADDVIDWFGLEPSADGEVFLSVSAGMPVDSLVTIALDLVERGAARERSAALGYLSEALGR